MESTPGKSDHHTEGRVAVLVSPGRRSEDRPLRRSLQSRDQRVGVITVWEETYCFKDAEKQLTREPFLTLCLSIRVVTKS